MQSYRPMLTHSKVQYILQIAPIPASKSLSNNEMSVLQPQSITSASETVQTQQLLLLPQSISLSTLSPQGSQTILKLTHFILAALSKEISSGTQRDLTLNINNHCTLLTTLKCYSFLLNTKQALGPQANTGNDKTVEEHSF